MKTPREGEAGLTLSIGRKQERPDYKSYCYDKYALRCAKCAIDEALGEKASPKIQVTYGGKTSRNSAAHLRPVGMRPIRAGQCVLRGKGALLMAPFSFVSFSFGRAKENENRA